MVLLKNVPSMPVETARQIAADCAMLFERQAVPALHELPRMIEALAVLGKQERSIVMNLNAVKQKHDKARAKLRELERQSDGRAGKTV